jgi:hypothetical protein
VLSLCRRRRLRGAGDTRTQGHRTDDVVDADAEVVQLWRLDRAISVGGCTVEIVDVRLDVCLFVALANEAFSAGDRAVPSRLDLELWMR